MRFERAYVPDSVIRKRARCSVEIHVGRANRTARIDGRRAGLEVVVARGSVDEHRVGRYVSVASRLIGSSLIVGRRIAEDKVVLPSGIVETCVRFNDQTYRVLNNNVVAVILGRLRIKEIEPNAGTVTNEGIICNLRRIALRKSQVNGSTRIIFKDVIDDLRRRAIDERYHA